MFFDKSVSIMCEIDITYQKCVYTMNYCACVTQMTGRDHEQEGIGCFDVVRRRLLEGVMSMWRVLYMDLLYQQLIPRGYFNSREFV